jgi:hypothetical protein
VTRTARRYTKYRYGSDEDVTSFSAFIHAVRWYNTYTYGGGGVVYVVPRTYPFDLTAVNSFICYSSCVNANNETMVIIVFF